MLYWYVVYSTVRCLIYFRAIITISVTLNPYILQCYETFVGYKPVTYVT